MANDDIAGYLIRRELENGEDEFWNPTDQWVSDPGESELYEEEDEAEAVAALLREKDESSAISVEEVLYDDEEELDD